VVLDARRCQILGYWEVPDKWWFWAVDFTGQLVVLDGRRCQILGNAGQVLVLGSGCLPDS
jgi:hypothetical protein